MIPNEDIVITKEDLLKDLQFNWEIERPTEEEIKCMRDAGIDVVKLFEADNVCPYCRGEGVIVSAMADSGLQIGDVCPRCKKEKTNLIDTNYWQYSGDILQVPANFRRKWYPDQCKENVQNQRLEKTKQYQLLDCVDKMNSVLFSFENKWRKDAQFYFISVPPSLEPDLWAYNLLQLYRVKGFSLGGLCSLREINIETSFDTKYFTTEVLCLRLTQIDKREVLKIDTILTERYLKGLTTIIISPTPVGSYLTSSGEFITTQPTLDITYFC